VSQTISRPPERHDDQSPERLVDLPQQRQVDRPTEWVALYHREGVPVRSDDHPVGDPEPEDWGWHGSMGKWGRRLWVLPFALIAAYLVTDLHSPEGHVASVWLIAVGVVMLLLVVVDWRRRRNAWRSE